MTSFANSLKSEIARVARKELKSEVVALRKAASTSRSEIAALKKQLKSLQSALRQVSKAVATNAIAKPAKPVKTVAGSAPVGRRPRVPFGPAKLLEHRKKLGLTQAQMAQLLDASTLSVHKWEAGNTVPRAAQLAKIAQVLKLGKREAAKLMNQ